VVQSPEFEGTIYELTGPEITLGRLPENAIQIPHSSVSSRHLILSSDGGDYNVRDLNSTNGTRVNGAKIVQHQLQRQDILHVGNIQLIYESELGGDLAPLPEPTQGIELNPNNTSVRPANFVNSSPIAKPGSSAGSAKDPTNTLVGVLAGLAVVAVGFYLFRMFV
jgi:pSer/pThr/pTyr-binding forkhead associated (FHA) protein